MLQLEGQKLRQLTQPLLRMQEASNWYKFLALPLAVRSEVDTSHRNSAIFSIAEAGG